MIDNIIVVVFTNVKAAYDAAYAIKGVSELGKAKLKVKGGIIVTKDDRGDVKVLEADVHPFHGTQVGAVAGGLIGLIGGAPIAAVGALLGATVGAIEDGGMAILKSRKVTEIKESMHPGTTAIIIEAEEASPDAVDDIVAKGGGRVFRPSA